MRLFIITKIPGVGSPPDDVAVSFEMAALAASIANLSLKLILQEATVSARASKCIWKEKSV